MTKQALARVLLDSFQREHKDPAMISALLGDNVGCKVSFSVMPSGTVYYELSNKGKYICKLKGKALD